jgi:general stress protein 26
MTTHEKHEENVRKLREMIRGIEVAMLTTVQDDGRHRIHSLKSTQFRRPANLE